jgi:hypothetical protein
MMHVQLNAVRSLRRHVQAACKSGAYRLRVVGSQSEGFSLAGERGEGLVCFGPRFEQQKRCVAYGRLKCGSDAVKVLRKKVA